MIPRFIQERLRGEGELRTTLRDAKKINLPQQQLFHRDWLCVECEGVLSRDETYVATNIDQPFERGELKDFQVTEEVRRFCAGLAWRIISWGQFRPDDGLARSEAFHGKWAAHTLRSYLLGQSDHPKNVEHHLYFPPAYVGPRRGINTFYGVTLVASVVTSGGYVYTLACLGGYVAISLLNPERWDMADWNGGTRVVIGERMTIASQTIPSDRFHRIVDEMIDEERRGNGTMSARQRQKTRQRAAKLSPGTRARSRAFRCLEADLENRRIYGPHDGDI
jgi:hypothetical protein